MSIELDHVVPWGRSFDEYVRMFGLRENDLTQRMLDAAAGPASFNATMHSHGRRVVSCDPLYRFTAAEIRGRITATSDTILRKTIEAREHFVWTDIRSPEQLLDRRMAAMMRFLEDFPIGLSEGRYRVAELPSLPFLNAEFDLALCSHFLFTYSHLLSLEFHLASVRELCRVAREVRFFPLLPSFGTAHSAHLAPMEKQLTAEGYRCEIRRVAYEFQKGGDEMLRVISP